MCMLVSASTQVCVRMFGMCVFCSCMCVYVCMLVGAWLCMVFFFNMCVYVYVLC